jgi:hypothetical protein
MRPGASDPPPAEGPPDRIEIWARRTGRFLGFAALFVLAVYLLLSYAPR